MIKANDLIRDHRHLPVEVMFEPVEFFSHCCHAPIYYETDICSKCENHCKIMKVCDNCEGSGTIRGEVREWMISPPDDDCPECSGSGEVEGDIK